MGNGAALLDAEPDVHAADKLPKTKRVVVPEFAGTFESSKVSFGYKFGLVAVAVGMILLVAVYVGLIAMVAWTVFCHLKGNSSIIQHSVNYASLVIYLWPAVAGSILVFFMIKPIFAGQPEQAPKYSLTVKSDPVLFDFINRICKLVGAPLPSRVDVDCDINASAGFRRGLLSMKGNDVVLTIGLPLAAGLTMQEFAGVLAHEFGHFAQGAGMRLTYVIRATSAWFARVVYERDEWDVRLARAAYGIDLRIGIFLHLIRLAVWISRRILWSLMHTGLMFSCFMRRQMEFDADTYAVKLAGSEAFARTTSRLRDLGAGGMWASFKINESWKSRRLPEDLPAFICTSVKNVPIEKRKELDEKAKEKKFRLFDTHPRDEDRIKAARAMKMRGVFESDEPASALFNDFSGLCMAATRFHYEQNLELKITDHNLVAQEIAENDSKSEADGDRGLRDFFFGLKLFYRPLLISEMETESMPIEQVIESLKAARQAMESIKPEVEKALAEYEKCETLYQRGYDAVSQNTQQATGKATSEMQLLLPTIKPFEDQVITRLNCALCLLDDPRYAEKIKDATALQREARLMRVVFARLGQAFSQLQELRRNFNALSAAISARQEEKRRTRRLEAAEKRMSDLTPEIQKLIKEIGETIRDTPYPFHHAREDITLEDFARNDIPANHKLESLCNDCVCQLRSLIPLYHRVLGRLAFIALTVEEGL